MGAPEREEEREAEAEELGAEGVGCWGGAAVSACAVLHGVRRRRLGGGRLRFSFASFPCLPRPPGQPRSFPGTLHIFCT